MSIKKMKMTALVFCMVLLSLNLFAQSEKLVFSAVCLCKAEPGLSWIEIMNPTEKPLVLEKFRFSHIRTTNILPVEIQEKGGIEIPPGKVFILCASRKEFFQKWDVDESMVFEIEAIRHFDEGGFIAIKTKGQRRNALDAVRYGNPSITTEYENLMGNLVLKWTAGDKSNRLKMSVDGGYEVSIEKTSPGNIY